MRGLDPRHMLALMAVGLVACSDEAAVVPADIVEPTGEGRVTISVQPLTLETMSSVCYALEVWNGATDDFGFPTPELVWSRNNVCSTEFGNGPGGGISYVGTCDASTPTNIVTLGIENVLGTAGVPLAEGMEWFNPCPLDSRCELYAPCTENADTPVVFNITVMRSANQGFFDVAVRFDQVYCSGKIDCSHDPQGEEPLLLLHGRDGERAETAVVAIACTSGPWLTDTTEIYLNHVRVHCDAPAPGGANDVVMAPNVTGLEGNQWDIDAVPVADPVWQYATYFGNEELFCDGLPCNKKYLDIAIGYDPAAVGCRLEVEVTVARPGVFQGFDSPAQTTYPVLMGRVQLTPGTEPTGLPMCRKGPLNGEGSGFHTVYTAMANEGVPFCWRFANGTFEARPDGLCDAPDHYDFMEVQPLLCESGPSRLLSPAGVEAALNILPECRNGPVNPTFACGEREFVDPTAICDGLADCVGGEDEIALGCNTPLSTCPDGATQYSDLQLCDGLPKCPDGFDELQNGCTTDLLACGAGADVHVAAQACDGEIDCRNGWDEGASGSPYLCDPLLFMWTCASGDQVIELDAVCDGWEDCDDVSDEAVCP